MELHTVRASAPGKVILHGEHSVVYGKTAIAASLGLRTSIVIEEMNDLNETLTLILPKVQIEETFKLKQIRDNLFNHNVDWKHPTDINHDEHLSNVEAFITTAKPECDNLKSHQLNALKGVLYLFSGILGSTDLKMNSMRIEIKSQLTIGAGTGSSASYAVVLSAALLRLLMLKTGIGREFTSVERNLVCGWAFNCDKIMHGTPSGIDNATCTFGSVVSFRKGSAPRSLSITTAVRVLLVDSRVARETRALTARVAALRSRNMAAVDHVMSAIEELTHTATEVLTEMSGNNEKDNLSRFEHLAELWDMNHCLLSSLGVSHPRLEEARAAAAARGLASKLTGAGGGGYAMILITPQCEESTVASLTRQLIEKGFTVTETKLGGPGVTID